MVTIKFGGDDGNVDDDDDDDDDDGDDDDDDGDDDGDDVDPAREEEEADLSAWLTPIDIIFPSSLASPVSHFPRPHTHRQHLTSPPPPPPPPPPLPPRLPHFPPPLPPVASCPVPSAQLLATIIASLSLSLDELIRISTSPTNIISSALGLVSVNCY